MLVSVLRYVFSSDHFARIDARVQISAPSRWFDKTPSVTHFLVYFERLFTYRGRRAES